MKKAWTIAMIGGLFFTFYFMQMTFLNPIAEGISHTFNLSAEELGNLGAVYLLAAALMSLPAGMLADKCASRPLMLSLLAASTISVLIMRFVEHYPALLLIRFIQGLLHSFCLLTALKLASQWIPTRQMATASSFIITIGLLGGAITQPLFLWFYTQWGIMDTFLANAMIGVALWVLFFCVIRDNPAAPVHHEHAQWKTFAQGLKQSVSKLQNSLTGVYVCFLNLPLIIFGTSWGSLYIEHTFGITGEEGALVLSMVFFGLMVGSPIAGFISDAYHTRKAVLAWGAFATFLMFVSLFILNHPSVILLAITFFGVGFISSCQVVAYPMVTESNPPAFSATALSVVSTVLMLGNAICQAVFSKVVSNHTVADAVTQQPLYTSASFNAAVWGMAISLVIAGVIAFSFKESFKASI